MRGSNTRQMTRGSRDNQGFQFEFKTKEEGTDLGTLHIQFAIVQKLSSAELN